MKSHSDTRHRPASADRKPCLSGARPIGVGLFGVNGHQVDARLENHPDAEVVAAAAIPESWLPPDAPHIMRCRSLAELIAVPAVDLVILCSPRRAHQTEEAVACLQGGKHVLAEKPSALHLADLDRILEAAARSGKIFHEMAGSAFIEPFASLFALVRQGTIGPVRQIYAQKSYPLYEGRPDDAQIDGGMFLQAGIHAARWIDHGLDCEIFGGNGHQVFGTNGRVSAASVLLDVGPSAAATLVVNYLNTRRAERWGDETLRVWGEDGYLAIEDGGERTLRVKNGKSQGPIPRISEHKDDWLAWVLQDIRQTRAMPLTLPRELRPLRGLLRCRMSHAG